jgi:hypothetical protein
MGLSRIAAALVLGATALAYAADPEVSPPDAATPSAAVPPAASAQATPKPGPTPTAAHLKTAAQLLDLVHVDRTTKQTLDVLLKMQLQQQPKLQPYEDVLRSFLQKYMSWDSLKTDYARIYAEAFTEDELRQIITFYKTPAGQKAINKIPTLMGMGAALGQKRVQENRAELQEMINAKQKEMQEHHAVP